MQSLEGLIGFAQKVSIKKKGEAVGKTCDAFLSDFDIFKLVLAGMMCDGATETMELIRHMDSENVDTVTMNKVVEQFLDNIYWLFFEDGVFTIQGHTTFIIEWIESKPHHFICHGESKCFGGSQIQSSILKRSVSHMQAWSKLAKYTCEAEFPSFALFSCLSVFELPREIPRNFKFCPVEVERKVLRMGVMFGKSLALSQYKLYWHRAYAAYKASNFTLSFYAAWMRGIDNYGYFESGHIEHICLRGEAFSAATSKVEQSFSKIDQLLHKNRLNASAPMENMYVNLFMSSDMNDAELESVIDGAIIVWKAIHPSAHSRLHIQTRRDKGMPRQCVNEGASSSGGEKPTEKTFLNNIRSVVANASKRGASEALLESDMPLWDNSHEDELDFQKQKRRKKEVEACLQDHLLPDEKGVALQLASAAEKIRQAKSYASRLKDRLKYTMKTTAVPPTPSELFRSKVYLDGGTHLPSEWHATLTRVEATVTTDLNHATMFVADNPRSPMSPIITLVASLTGSWVVSPSVFVGNAGPSVKYLESMATKRLVWVSPAFQQTYPREWLAILEVANNTNVICKWTFLGSCKAWANARAIAESKKRPTDVIALVGPLEMNDKLKHCFGVVELITFMAHSHPNKGSIGVLNM